MNMRTCKPDNEWSKSYICRPKDNLISHQYLHRPQFKASFEKEGTGQPPMALLLSWEYSRIWQRENCEFVKKRIASEQLKPVSDPLEKVRRRNAEKKEKQKKYLKEKENLVISKFQRKLELQRLKTQKKKVQVAKNSDTAVEKPAEKPKP